MEDKVNKQTKAGDAHAQCYQHPGGWATWLELPCSMLVISNNETAPR